MSIAMVLALLAQPMMAAPEPESFPPSLELLEYIGALEEDENGYLLDPLDTLPDEPESEDQDIHQVRSFTEPEAP